MITKMENGSTLIILGEGTVFTGNVYVDDSDIASGVFFTNEKWGTNPDGSIIIQITNEKAVASYLMSLLRVVETWSDKEEISKIIKKIKQELEPLLPIEKK